MTDLMELIETRKSVRSFDGRPVSAEDRSRLAEYMNTITNPFGIPVSFVLLDAKENNLSSPVLTGETLYVAGKVVKRDYADVAFGFSFEKLVLYAWSLGVGTTWIGGTMKRETFEHAAGLCDGEMMPCISPLGYPAKKRSVREALMRKGVSADTRLPVETLFFENSWETPLSAAIQEELHELMEMVRWAPSAVNKQPWRIVTADGVFHFYEKQDKGYVSEKTGDLQKIDVGIALCHAVMALEAQGETTEVVVRNPGISVPDGVKYIASVQTESV